MTIKKALTISTLIGTGTGVTNFANWYSFNQTKKRKISMNGNTMHKLALCCGKGWIYSGIYPFVMLECLVGLGNKTTIMKHLYPGSIHGSSNDQQDFREWMTYEVRP